MGSGEKNMQKKVAKVEKKEDDGKLFAFLAVLLSILGFIIALLAKKDNKYVMFYAKQSLVLFIAFIIAGAVMIVPIVGWIVGFVVYIITIILWIIALIYSLSGEMKETPIIGKYAEKISL